MKIVHVWVAIGLAALAVGCGQKGPLVLPDAPKHKKVLSGPHTPTTPPASTKPTSTEAGTGTPAPTGTSPPPDAAGNPADSAAKP